MKKAANLKKRLDELRDEPEPPMELTLHLDGNLQRTLKHLAAQEHLSLEAYLLSVLCNHIKADTDEKAGEGGIEILA